MHPTTRKTPNLQFDENALRGPLSACLLPREARRLVGIGFDNAIYLGQIPEHFAGDTRFFRRDECVRWLEKENERLLADMTAGRN